MSAVVRQALATAATTVDDVNASPYYRQSTKPGDAFVRLDQLNADDSGLGFMVAWQVCVVLPQDQAAAERWIETHLPALLAALADEGAVTSAQPVQLALDGPIVPALILTVIRAQE